jgi:hypothetical protein
MEPIATWDHNCQPFLIADNDSSQLSLILEEELEAWKNEAQWVLWEKREASKMGRAIRVK